MLRPQQKRRRLKMTHHDNSCIERCGSSDICVASTTISSEFALIGMDAFAVYRAFLSSY